jgi:thymidine kinase
MANLDIIIGPMFAGKSCELIRRIRLLKVLKKEYIVIKPKIDNRYDNLYDSNMIISHNFDKEHCIVLNHMNEIYNHNLYGIDTIFIDEGQFFDDLVEVVKKLVEIDGKNVIVTGLDGDSNRNKFGHILDLIPLCDKVTKLTSLCMICKNGTPGIFSKRITFEKEQTVVGSDNYIPVCRSCYDKQL